MYDVIIMMYLICCFGTNKFSKMKKELLIYFRFGDVCERSRTTYQVASEGFSVGNEMQETDEKSN